MSKGFTGNILRVNLTSGDIDIEHPPESLYRTYLGGSALNLHYLLNEMRPGIDPLGPDNILAISVGIATGTAIPGQSRATASAKSPLTGAIGDSQSGGFWPAHLKFAGFDGVIIEGRSPTPVYLWIHDGQAELRDAGHLWGMLTGDAQTALRQELNDEGLQVLQIGPAGEKQVRFAALISMCNRANGRTGMGAVMGSKRLKAIALSGTRKPEIADRHAFKDLAQSGVKAFPRSMIAGMRRFGTSGAVGGNQSVGGLPSFNFSSGVFDNWEAIDGTTLYDTILKGCQHGRQQKDGRDTCFGCVVYCKPVVEITSGEQPVDPLYGGPEYETLAAFGAFCGIDDLNAVAKANEICNKYGMDTISCGASIAWAMEAFGAGELKSTATGGMAIKFGDRATMLQLVEMIARRQGFGDILAEGSSRAAEQLGCGAALLTTSKGQEAPAHMPHLKRSLALIYAVNPFGADHMSSAHDPAYENGFEHFKERLRLMGLTRPQAPQSLNADKIEFARKTQYLYSMLDSLSLCQFVYGDSWQLFGPQEILKLIESVAGWRMTIDELLEVGERRLNMMRIFNAREGFDRRNDTLPMKFFTQPLDRGPTAGWKIDRAQFEAALDEYYRQCGWDEDRGLPEPETLERLGLEWTLKDSRP